ncbi:sigma-70 family RNA polymerase sigma factor [Occallatibacter savannae]|uniref:sigma-70 family RNA polymerase sigma factor n=1 Tax=Occallatibacter savannae TaxID=1002691 RepID=UPI001EF4793B|nr:sigma-70 family RNA polymerase sigma factor [Occallatibacter savannae]
MSTESNNPFPPERRTHGETVSSRAIGAGEMGSDQSLMAEVRAGGEQAMAKVFDRYAGLVYSVALRVLKDAGQAEDVMQEIFFQLWRNPDSFSFSRGTLGTWLLVVARNRAIDQLRQRRPAEPVDEVVVASTTNLQSEAERSILMQRVRGIVGDLPQEQQQSLQLAFFDGLSHSEIAERTGQPLGTVKTRIRSALSSLRKRLEA